jgi:hypothetical protein
MNDIPLINADARPSNDIREVTRRLNAALGPTLVSTLAGLADTGASKEWAKGDGPAPSPEAARRLVFAYEQWQRVVEAEDEDIARLWFVGMNPWLGDDSAIEAIREDRLKEVRYAVQALVDDTWSG